MLWQASGAKVRIAAKHADKIRKGFQKAFNADDIVEKWFHSHIGASSTTTQQARDWALASITPNKKYLLDALKPLYADGWVLGTVAAQEALRGVQKAPDVGVVDWNTWKPGNQAAAELIKPSGGLQTLLDRRGIVIDGISNTKLDRIGTVLGRAIADGITPRQVSIMVDRVINDPQQALVIAQTEMSRAVSVAARNDYINSGVEQVEWLVAVGCEDCQMNADASPLGIDEVFPSGDTEPPAHPNCMCDLAPYVVDTSNLQEKQMALVQTNNTVGTTAQIVFTVPTGNRQNIPVYVDNLDTAAVWIGDAAITTSGATQGIKLAAGASRQLWCNSGDNIYAISAAGTGAGLVVVTASV